jgi:hypothetical protein
MFGQEPFIKKSLCLYKTSNKMEIIWSAEAKKTFKNNIIYLQNNWSKNEVDFFISETFRCIELIKTNKYIGKYNQSLKCNVLLVMKQISIFYDIQENKIQIITFWDNRKKPIKSLHI